MKYLCVCQYGHSRSAALVRVLHARGIEAIAVGWMTSRSLIPLLADVWADKIVVLQAEYVQYIPPQHIDKLMIMDVGPDKWSNPYNQDLLHLLETMCVRDKVIQ